MALLEDSRRKASRRGGSGPSLRALVVPSAISAAAIVAGILIARHHHPQRWVDPAVLAVAAAICVLAFRILASDWVLHIAALLAAAAAIYGIIAGLSSVLSNPPEFPDGKPVKDDGRTVVVYNKIPSGPHGMIEDGTPLSLFTKPRLCSDASCTIAGIRYWSGARITGVICQVKNGDTITNGNNQTAADNHNPGLATSHRWLGVKLTTGRTAYVSVVWTQPSDRSGLGLPVCKMS
jgi:hypothetical protein